MKKTYIAFGVNNEPVAVIMAIDKKDAEIALAGMNEPAKHIEEIDPSTVIGVHGVVFLLTSTKANSRDFSHRVGGVDFRIWKRGL